MQKRGQITVYLIIGFVILVAVVTIFLIRGGILKSSLERDIEKYANVPEQVRPVKEFMDGCLYGITSEALKRAGSQGGYVYVPEDNLPVNPITPFSNALSLSSGQEVPYWFYETSNGIQRSQIPDEDEVKEQISRFIIENIGVCVASLNGFSEDGYDFSIDYEPETNILIEDERTIVSVDLPVEVSLKDFNFNLDKHFAIIEVPFGKLYDEARKIQEIEQTTNIFEEKTFDVIASYDEIPLSGTELTCTEKVWSKYEIIQELKDLISLNLGALKPSQENAIGGYFSMGLNDVTSDSFFLYSPTWPTKVDIYPSENGILKSDQITREFSDSLGALGSFLCIDNYHFVYDIQYPLLITLVDSTNENFVFQYATQVIIKNNQPKENKLGNLELPELDFPICENPSNEITVFTFGTDQYGNIQPLENVNINFKCFTTKCKMGISRKDEFNEAVLTEEFPFCMNGLLIGEKEGYYKAEKFLTTNEEKQIILILEPLREKNIDVRLIEKNTGDVRDPYESERVIFELENKNNDFSATFVYPDIEKINLIPGEYNIKSYVIGDSTWPITLRGQSYEKCIETKIPTILGLYKKDEECFNVDIDDIIVDEVIKGGAEFEWNLDYETINKNQITFYTMVDNIPGTQQELSSLYFSIEDNENNPNFRYPE